MLIILQMQEEEEPKLGGDIAEEDQVKVFKEVVFCSPVDSVKFDC